MPKSPGYCWLCRAGVVIGVTALVAGIIGSLGAAGAAAPGAAAVATFFGTTAGKVTAVIAGLVGLSVPAIIDGICCKIGGVCCD